LGCVGSLLYPLWYLAAFSTADQGPAGATQTPRASLGWVVLVVILAVCIGFFYSAGMFIVFSRVKQMK
jgi:hypothetical protein